MATKIATKSKETFHFINKPADAINEALTGLTQCCPQLSYDAAHRIVYRRDLESFRDDHVTVIACSGGGHEPMFSGFVGHNFLSAFVSGNVFASPTSRQIFEAIKMCQPDQKQGMSSRGTLLVVCNYTGDVLNAGMAITRSTAAGFNVNFVAVGDDVAVGREKGAKVGRRGLSGNVIALKCACALAQRGESLERVTEVMKYVASNVGTIGVAFDRVALPNNMVTELYTLPPDTIELGMGAHGEPGLQQISPIPSPKDLTESMIKLLIDMSDTDRAFIPFSNKKNTDEVVLLLNSLGSTSDDVLAKFADLGIKELQRQGIKVTRLTFGPLVTSLKMSGFGFTVWKLPSGSGGCLDIDEALSLWDQTVDVAAWKQ